MEYQGHILHGKLALPDHIRALRGKYLESLPEGTAVVETIQRIGTPKTHQQVKAFFGMIVASAAERFNDIGIDVMGVPLSRDMVKELMYHYCGGVGDHGESVRLSKMTTIQASTFFNNCRDWLATFGVVVPNPDPQWREKQEGKK
jgi:hypothetical protein